VANDLHMRAFWDQKAMDNPLWYVTTTLDFERPDEAEFWASGIDEVHKALTAAGVSAGNFAVEIGCGIGRLTRALAARFNTVWACDVSPNMLDHARENLHEPNVTLALASGDGTLHVVDGSADLVLSMQVFHHIPAQSVTLRYVAEAGRVLAPGGSFVFQLRTCRASGILGGAERLVRGALGDYRRRRTPPPADLDAAAWRGSRVLRSELRRTAKAAGMTVVRLDWLDARGANALVVCRKDGAR
jgi:SAM-dependent methyltransferase